MIGKAVLWILGPTRTPWSKSEKITITREGTSFVASAVTLVLIYTVIQQQEQLYFEQIDKNLVLLLDALVMPIVLWVFLLILRRDDDKDAVFQTLSWLYRAWTVQLLLLWFWALVLKQNKILSHQEAPIPTNFSLVLVVTTIMVSVMVAVSMRRGKESWVNILCAWGIYWCATLISQKLGIPTASEHPWWAPNIEFS